MAGLMASAEIDELVAELPARSELDGFWDRMDARLADGGAAFLADVGIALRRTYGIRPVPNVRSAVDGLLRRLALLPWPGHVPQVLRLAAGAGIASRYVASLLAAGQDLADLAPALAPTSPATLRACLAQELVLRGARDPAPMPIGHPLSVLPGVRTALEHDPPLPRYGLDWTRRPTTLELIPVDEEAPAGDVPPFMTSPAPVGSDAAVATWSTGTIETRLVEVVEPLLEEAIPLVVGALGLEHPGSQVQGSACEPRTVWRLLFVAASLGGPRNLGEYGAFGRLAAWRTLGALSGAGEHARIAEIERRAGECAWYRFRVGEPGIYHDLGLAALSPDRCRIAVLAAVDPGTRPA
ncbi:DUF6183 family protein [Pseudonocardia thermophila]|uniref:DUF6183 family protein n=1 Tax=Pseudonocardia thermophila TaxID=1848 RepID=UPI00248E8FDE|nr:DUF6183 family protein [Pseudonocardia thermophila]